MFLIVSLVILVSVKPESNRIVWNKYKANHGLHFNGKEDLERMLIFHENVRYIEDENRKNLGFKMEINKFAHITDQEFSNKYLSKEKFHSNGFTSNIPTKLFNDKFKIDWREHGVVTTVKDQGKCGSCWAFAITATIESAYAIKNKTLFNLSAQQLVDCSTGNMGCNGGNEWFSYSYLQKFGLQTWRSYPYTAKQEICKYNKTAVVVVPKKYKHLWFGEYSLSKALKSQPVSVRIYASLKSFRFYKSGVYYDPECFPIFTNHLVTAVGYVVNATDNYFIIKNSWGVGWGNKGYVNLKRGTWMNCGVGTFPTYPEL